MKRIFGLSILVSILFFSCHFFEEKKSDLPTNWEMIDMFEDEIDEINEGGYYALYRNEPRPKTDSVPSDEEINDNIVAMAVESKIQKGKSKAIIWVADSKQILTLDKDETIDKKSYKRTYSNEDFTVDLDMKFFEKIDGMDEEDMYIYRGVMKISQNGTDKSQELKVKGGI